MSDVCSKALRWPATHFSRLESKLVDFVLATVYDVQHFTICIQYISLVLENSVLCGQFRAA